MTNKEMLEKMTAEEYETFMGQLMFVGSLPRKEDYTDILDEDFIVAAKNMKSDNDVKYALMLCQEINMYIDLKKLDDNSKECEDLCCMCQLQFAEIMIYWFGRRKYKENKETTIMLIIDNFWDFIRGDINFETLKKNVIKLNNKYICD